MIFGVTSAQRGKHGARLISYSRKDETFARQLADRLGSVAWIDVKDIRVGENWSDAIQQALNTCQAMVLIITSNSMKSKILRG